MRWPVSVWTSLPSSAGNTCLWSEPHQYFWYHTLLQASNQMEEGIEVLVLNVTLCLFATWIFLYVTMVTRIKISVLVSAPMVTFLLGLGATSVPSRSSMQEAIPTSRKLCDPASWSPSLCRNLIHLSPLLNRPWVPAFPGFTTCTLICASVLLSGIPSVAYVVCVWPSPCLCPLLVSVSCEHLDSLAHPKRPKHFILDEILQIQTPPGPVDPVQRGLFSLLFLSLWPDKKQLHGERIYLGSWCEGVQSTVEGKV